MLPPEDQKQPKPFVIVHQDGSKETVYLSEAPKTGSFKENLMMGYFVVGTIALALTAYLTYLQLKKM